MAVMVGIRPELTWMYEIAGALLVLLCLCGAAYSALMLWRNEQVYRYRTQLAEDIKRCSQTDIERGRAWEWRYQAYDRVPYTDMLRRFWQPLPSFYGDHGFHREPEQMQ